MQRPDATDTASTPATRAPRLHQRTQAELDRVYPLQTNVFFHVQPPLAVTAAFDANGDGRLQAENSVEPGLIRNAFNTSIPHAPATQSNLFVFFVPALYVNPAGKQVGGFATPLVALYGAYVQWKWTNATGGLIESITSHELGHLLGRGGLYEATPSRAAFKTFAHPDEAPYYTKPGLCSDCLMLSDTDPSTVRRRLLRDDWNSINFVEGSPVWIMSKPPSP